MLNDTFPSEAEGRGGLSGTEQSNTSSPAEFQTSGNSWEQTEGMSPNYINVP